MKNYKGKVLVSFLIMLLLYGCKNIEHNDVNQDDVAPVFVDQIIDSITDLEKPVSDDQNVEIEEPVSDDQIVEENKQSTYLFLNSPNEIDLYPLYFDGLKHSSAEVRWFSCYKMIDFYNSTQKHNEIKEALRHLLTDPNIDIRNSAEFVLSLFDNTFNKNEFIKSPNGKFIAFYKYRGITYNDGICYIYDIERDYIYSLDNSLLSIISLSWSPDGNILSVFHGGRTWSDTDFIDISNNTTYTIGLHSYINEKQKELGYVLGEWVRPDPTSNVIEWSPDNKKVLLSYTFIDDNRVGQKGLCIYNFEQAKIEKIIKLGHFDEDHPSIEKPHDFKW